MFRTLSNNLSPYAPTLLRLMVGFTFMLHGYAKLQNPAGFIGFVGSLGFPAPALFGWLVILLEFAGGILLMLGLGTRWLGLAFAVEMIFTTALVKSQIGFIAPGGQPGVGMELDLNLMVGALALALLGAGQLSVDNILVRRQAKVSSSPQAAD